MTSSRILSALVVITAAGSSTGQWLFAADIDSTRAAARKAPRTYVATRLQGEPPIVEGVLNDPCWAEGTWAGEFTQWIPNEGAKPSQPTQLKVLYDDRCIYVAIRAFDGEPEKISRRAGKRDEFNGDIVGITFDSYHDHRTGFEFDVTAAGQKIDLVLTNPSSIDPNWNAVWDGAAGSEDSAWTAEFKIPLSQLRYSNDQEQIWGMHCWRWIDRLQEESDWEPQSSTGPGAVYLFGELHGIRNLPRSRRIEIMPYTLGELKTFPIDRHNPFAGKGRRWLGNAGLDAKIGLTSNITADLSINPDFGQVEADPSVMNLTAFETFFEEKRPFFLEGRSIFAFDFDDVNMFYSRRIGHLPTYAPPLQEGEFIQFPDYTTILSALKVSGKTSDGLAVGVLQSITDKETASIKGPTTEKVVAVEPLTSYSVARVEQDFGEGNTALGGILTATNRFINDPQLTSMNRNAFTGGIDLLHQWNDKEFFLTAKIVAGTVAGSTDAITALQGSSARYYQRPDIRYVHFDSSRTSLAGYGGQIRIGKGSKGLWRYSSELNWRSPGLDLNDLGYMQLADVIKLRNSVSYFVNQSESIFRTYSLGISQTSAWDFGGRYLSTSVGSTVYAEFLNNWAVGLSFTYNPEALDTRLLRGGYAMRIPASWTGSVVARTDPSRPVFAEWNVGFSRSADGSGQSSTIQPGLTARPVATLRLSASVAYQSTVDNLQYVALQEGGSDQQYILARIRQRSLGITFRIDYNITPVLSLQFYGSPFASTGRYASFKVVTDPLAGHYVDRFAGFDPVLNGSTYTGSIGPASVPTFSFEDPDFAFSQFRSNLVLRWEYLPGSQVYLVWSHQRTVYDQPGAGSLGGALGGLRSANPENLFVAKLNYWFSL
jgi:hypothetical protein